MSDDGSFETMGVKVFNFGDESGYAGIATRAIKKGDVLVRVPRSKMLTALDARSCPSIGNAAKLLSDERALVLKLLHLQLTQLLIPQLQFCQFLFSRIDHFLCSHPLHL